MGAGGRLFISVSCLQRATELKVRVPIPPALTYRQLHLEELARTAFAALLEMGRRREAFSKLESVSVRGDVTVSRGRCNSTRTVYANDRRKTFVGRS